jgi:triacylglycerol lipase
MSTFTFQTTASTYSRENAWWLGQAADIAYGKPGEIRRTFESWGLGKFRFINGKRTGTQAFVAGNRKLIIVAFRGTEPKKIKDWFTDAKVRQVDGVHRGFKGALEDVWDEVEDIIQVFKGRRLSFADVARRTRPLAAPSVWITGHSLGAALANLAVARMIEEDSPVAGLYTFGQPRTGSRRWARDFDQDFKDRAFRFVNNNDVVTRVPPRELGYRHVGTLRYFDVNGKMHEDISWWHRFLDGVEGRIDDFGKLGTDGLKDHSMERYLRGLARQRDG